MSENESIGIPAELSYGEKAVGIKFNPSNSEAVHVIKSEYAKIINGLDAQRKHSESQEAKRLYSIAITEAQGAQVWAVKAVTWKD